MCMFLDYKWKTRKKKHYWDKMLQRTRAVDGRCNDNKYYLKIKKRTLKTCKTKTFVPHKNPYV